jgi:putative addiction module component (TIGR02574 family)
MSPETDELLQRAMNLPLEARAELACSLIDSLDETVDEDAEVAWQQEVVRRMGEIRSGKVKTIPWREVQRKGRALLHGK